MNSVYSRLAQLDIEETLALAQDYEEELQECN